MSKLGKYGGMGNQLFQYAALYGISNKTGFEMRIPAPPKNLTGNFQVVGHTDEGNPIEKYDYSLDCFGVTSNYLSAKELTSISKVPSQKIGGGLFSLLLNKKIKYNYFETQFHFDPNIFLIKDQTDIEGYFQSEKYFSHCANDIRQEFSIKNKYLTEAQSRLDKYKIDCNTLISAHVRRKGHEVSEYQSVHKYPNEIYYNNAMNYFRSQFMNTKFLFFSDDLVWCKSKFIGDDIYYSENNSSIIDFTMMSLCAHNIITPSSYSWWASWLNSSDDKIVIVPDGDLFGPEGPKITKDYFPNSWQKISRDKVG